MTYRDLANANKQQKLEKVLERVLAGGHYEAALLSDVDGLPLAAVYNDADEPTDSAGIVAAVTALLRDAAAQARLQLELAFVNELSLVSDDRYRFVCRFFETDAGQLLSLTLVVPPDEAYRRNTNRAIREINEAWNT
jgi:predicted regulator of Ras-like GTPase activity (Roadblock/LC7/MglB family)